MAQGNFIRLLMIVKQKIKKEGEKHFNSSIDIPNLVTV